MTQSPSRARDAHPSLIAVREFVTREVEPAASALEHADAYPPALVALRHHPAEGGEDSLGRLVPLHQAIASMPVAKRPMMSFWICVVPSYSRFTRASRQ